MSDPLFDPGNEIKTAFVSWGKVGDWIKGVLVDVREMESRLPGKEGQMVKIYELQAKAGSFHQIDDQKKPIEPPVEVKEGQYWTIGGRAGIDNQLRNIKLGQIVGLKFAEERPPKTKGFNPTKIIKVFAGEMDPDYAGQTSKDVEL